MPKKRGGQKGNRNAFKHGFYSKYFNAFESKALSKSPHRYDRRDRPDARQRRSFHGAYTTSLPDLDYEERLSGLRAITLAVGRIVGLERILSTKGKNIQQYEEFMKMLQDIPEDESDSCHDRK